jgi:cation transporter-like permease
MSKHKPFIPRDKPKLWVIGVLSGLVGIVAGGIAFTAAAFEFQAIKLVFVTIFVFCWSVLAVSWVGFFIGSLSGRYKKLEPKRWKDQQW